MREPRHIRARGAVGVALMALLAAVPLAGQNAGRAADEAAIRAVIDAFIATREANDPAGLAALLTEDVDQQQTSGNVRRGRDAVVAGTMATQQGTGGRRTIGIETLRFLAPDVAIVDARYDSVGRADGTDRHMRTSMVLRREGGAWKLAAIRNMLPTER